MLRELQVLGFTPETVALLPLVPLVQMAWAEGGVSDAERRLILQFARTRGIEEGSGADRQLAGGAALLQLPICVRRVADSRAPRPDQLLLRLLD